METTGSLADFEAAVVASRDSGDATDLLDALRSSWPRLAPFHGPRLREAMDSLPTEAWDQDPWLVAAYGASYRSAHDSNPSAGLTYLDAAESLMTDGGPSYPRLVVQLRRAAFQRTLGLLDEALRSLDSAAVLLTEAKLPLSERIQIGCGVAVQRGVTLFHLGDLDGAKRNLIASVALPRSDRLPSDRIECLAALAIVSYSLGDFDATATYAEAARAESSETGGLATGFGAPALIAELLVAVEQDREADAEALREQVAIATAKNDWAPLGYYAQGAISILNEDYIEGLDLVGHCVRSYSEWQPVGPVATICEGLRATLLLRLGDTATAWEIFASLTPTQNHANCPARFVAHLRFVTGDTAGVLSALDDCVALGDLHSARTMVDIQLLLAAANYQLGNTATADIAFDRSMRLAARNDMRIPFRLVPDDVMRSMIARAGTRGQSPAVRSLFGLVSGTMRASITGQPKLSDREREIVRLMVRDRSASEIADELFVSINTVKSHLRNVYRKLGVRTRSDAIKKAKELGLHV